MFDFGGGGGPSANQTTQTSSGAGNIITGKGVQQVQSGAIGVGSGRYLESGSVDLSNLKGKYIAPGSTDLSGVKGDITFNSGPSADTLTSLLGSMTKANSDQIAAFTQATSGQIAALTQGNSGQAGQPKGVVSEITDAVAANPNMLTWLALGALGVLAFIFWFKN